MLSDRVTKLFGARTNPACVTLYRPLTVYPPPSGNRGSDGATTLNELKSVADRTRLSVALKLPSHRRVYCTSTDTLGRISCWIDAPIPQSYGRMPHPFRAPGS